jgi:hypothetical protein
MRFMIIRKADAETEAGALPSRELMDAMMAYNQEMVDAGVMLAGDGLRPSKHGFRVEFSSGKPTIVDGPFAESKELIAGYSIIEVNSREEAMQWVKRWPAEDAGGRARLEVRQLIEPEDFGDAFTADMQRHEELMREQAARNA